VKWPTNKTKCADYSKLVAPLRKLVKQTHTIAEKESLTFPLPWTGMADTGPTGRACAPTVVAEILSKSSVDYHRERGRDLMETVLGLAVSLGIEQGRRIEREKGADVKRWLMRACKDQELLKLVNELDSLDT
jgi:hypothetical protein